MLMSIGSFTIFFSAINSTITKVVLTKEVTKSYTNLWKRSEKLTKYYINYLSNLIIISVISFTHIINENVVYSTRFYSVTGIIWSDFPGFNLLPERGSLFPDYSRFIWANCSLLGQDFSTKVPQDPKMKSEIDVSKH